jgi:hypothetical protein
MSSRELPFFQDAGHINLPSVFYVNGVRMHRLPLKRGPKPKAGREVFRG